MYNKMELLFDDFYKIYYKMEELNLNLDIKCLTTTELHIIKTIGNEEITIKLLAEKLGITMGTTSIAVTKLVDKRFLIRTRSKQDKRQVFVSLSKKGKLAFNYHDNFHAITLKKITKNIDEKELQNFMKTFETLFSNLKNLKLKLEPENLNYFNENDIIEVVNVKGNSVIRLAVSELGIRLKTIIQIKKIHSESIEVLIDNNLKLITKDQATYIMGIKKEML